jgi:hypothetical protein
MQNWQKVFFAHAKNSKRVKRQQLTLCPATILFFKTLKGMQNESPMKFCLVQKVKYERNKNVGSQQGVALEVQFQCKKTVVGLYKIFCIKNYTHHQFV